MVSGAGSGEYSSSERGCILRRPQRMSALPPQRVAGSTYVGADLRRPVVPCCPYGKSDCSSMAALA
eukprot:13567-Rhodomonas_salina.2